MQPRARVLLLAAEDDLAAPLADGLDALGWGTVTARSLESAERAVADLELEAAIIDSRSGETGAVARLREAAGARRIPVVALGHPIEDADLLMTPPHAPAVPA